MSIANIRFLYDNDAFDAATLTASSEATGYEVSNLQDQRRKKTWRSTSVTGEYISINAAITANMIALINHNLTYEGTFRVTATNSDDYVSNLLLDETFDGWETVWGYGEGGYGLHGYGGVPLESEMDEVFTDNVRIYYFSAGSITASYWRVYFTDDDNADGYIELGRIMLGSYFEPTNNFTYKWGFTPVDRTKVDYTKGGQPVRYVRTKRYDIELHFPTVTRTDRWENFLELIGSYGIRKDIILQLFPKGSGGKKIFTSLYGRLKDVSPLTETFADWSEVTLNFRESL